MPEERKLATVLVADIVGSTASVSSRNPEVVRRTLAEAFARIRVSLVEHGGTVEKFIGDSVVAIFGVPVAHDDDAERAVRGAFAILGLIAEGNATASYPLELRVGVNSGEVVAGTEGGHELLVTGTAVNLAARLQQAAAPGEILVGPLTRSLTERAIEYAPSRIIDAKGLGEIAASAALHLGSVVPEQRRGVAGLRAPLVGRDDEMRVLVDTHRRLQGDRRPYLVTVFGGAGVGKSRLVAEFVDTVGRAHVRRGRCLPYGQGITLWPIQELLRADVGVLPDDSREAATQKLRAATLGALRGDVTADAESVARRLGVLAGIGSAAELLPDVAADTVNDELRFGLRRYLERRAADHPLTVIIDDIHWAEPALLELIEHLVDRSRAPILFLCLARPELLDTRPGWGGGRMNAAALPLEPLDEQESRRLIEELLAMDGLPESIRAEVVARSGGNPLYVEEFLRMLIDDGRIVHREGRWVATGAGGELIVPPTLQGIIAARLDRLGAAEKRTLQVAAVIGRVFWTGALAELGATGAEQALIEAARRDLVIETDQAGPGGGLAFRFSHILVRDVAYASIPMAERAGLHDRFGRWLEHTAGERREEYSEIVAHHAEQAFLHATAVGDRAAADLGPRAFALLANAGKKARQRTDPAASRAFYERALVVARDAEVPDAGRYEAEAFAALAADVLEGTPQTATRLEAILQLVRSYGPSEGLAMLGMAAAFKAVGTDAAGAALLYAESRRVAESIGDPDLIARAMVGAQWLPYGHGDLAAQQRILEEAWAYIEHEDRAAASRVPALNWLAANAVSRGAFTEAIGLRAKAIELADASGSLFTRLTMLSGSARLLIELRQTSEALRDARAGLVLAEEIGNRRMIARSHEVLGWCLLIGGGAAAARIELEAGLTASDPEAMRDVHPELCWRLALACLACGDRPLAARRAAEAVASSEPLDVHARAQSVATIGALHAAAGEVAEARAAFAEAQRILSPTGFRSVRAEIDQRYGESLIALGLPAEARVQLEAAAAFWSDPAAALRRAEIDSLLRVAAAR